MPSRLPAVDPARPWFRWWAILGALLVGTANPLVHYTLVVCVGLGVAYAACRLEGTQ